MPKHDIDALVREHRCVADSHYWMRLEAPSIAQQAEPGQFIHVQVRGDTSPLLRRPLTIYRRDETNFEALYQVIGHGTEVLSRVRPGEHLRILGPLGNRFHIPPEMQTAIVVGGGVGIASLMLLIEALASQPCDQHVLLGAQRASRLVAVDDIRALGVELHIATDDGSQGYHGFVTELADAMLQKRPPSPVVYGCGPTPMMQTLGRVTAQHGIPTQLALESYMGCALGVCLGCVVDVRSENGATERVRVCTEGPVFDAEEIVW